MTTRLPVESKQRRLGKAGQDLVRQMLVQGQTNRVIQKRLRDEGFEPISDSALSRYRAQPEVIAARKLAVDSAMRQGLADVGILVTYLHDTIIEIRHRMHGTEPDPDCLELVKPNSVPKSVPTKDYIRYSSVARQYVNTLIKLLAMNTVTVTETKPDGTTTTKEYHGEEAVRAAIDNQVNDMLERYIAQRDGMSVAEVRAKIDAIMHREDQTEEQRVAAARSVEVEVSDVVP
jgi:hypothetical protein